jgi:endoglucanase
MRKRVILLLSSIFCISILAYGVDAWIRINQLGYLPGAQKKAIFISESPQQIKQFTIYDALTNEELDVSTSVVDKGEFLSYKSTYILDFSSFKMQGAFYIKAGLIYSPTIFINKNVYLGSADFLLKFIRQQRCGYNPSLDAACHQQGGCEVTDEVSKFNNPVTKSVVSDNYLVSGTKIINKLVRQSSKAALAVTTESPASKFVDVRGGWHNSANYIQFGSISANAIYQMLFAYQMNPSSFTDAYGADGKLGSNHIPDVLDEAKWGLDWLLKMYPASEVLYHQVADDRDCVPLRLPTEDKVDYGWGFGANRPVYLATGKPQGLFKYKNHSTGVASIAGKYSAAFGLGAEILAGINPLYADSLKVKAVEAYQYGQRYPGVCQAVPAKSPFFYEEDNWTDDLELAAAQLYRLTYEKKYLKDATSFARMEPVSPWMCSDTARHFQWYPFVNLGHYVLSNVENPRYQKEFSQDLLNGIQRMKLYASANPFNIGVPMIWCSNNMVAALATQCRLYRTMTKDSSYLDMETALVDWLFGRNPWGAGMVVGLPRIGHTPSDSHSALSHNMHVPILGGLVDGPVDAKFFADFTGNRISKADAYERFQTSWAVYHDDYTDASTNEPTMDGTASLSYLLANSQQEGVPGKTADKNEYNAGGIIRTDADKKQLSLVFTGHEFADGYKTILKTLDKFNIKASFFFTGDFYRKSKFKSIVKSLMKDGHYLGAHSDKHLLYCSWQKRDSLLVTKSQFVNDIKANYSEMEKFGIRKDQAPFFLPSYEYYNDSISLWCREIGLQLVNYTPGTLTNADSSIPEMREKYFSSNEIYNKVMQAELKQGLNGNILLFHIGSDKRRQDKFYPRLAALLTALSRAGYEFVDLYKSTDVVDKNIISTDKKHKRKN